MSIEEYIKEKRLSAAEGENGDKIRSFDRNIVKTKIMQVIKDKISEQRDIDVTNMKEAKRIVTELAHKWIEEEVDLNYAHLMLTAHDKHEILEALIQHIFGYGVIEPYLKDKEVTEIMINGPKVIFVEKNGKLSRAVDKRGNAIAFSSNEELKTIIDKIVAPINRKVDESDPIVDARLPDGSRVNVVLNPIALDGTAVTIRKFPENPYTMEQLIQFGSLPGHVAKLLQKMVQGRYNIIVSGGTGSGKTTFLNALSMYIPANSRVVTVEDSAELKFSQVENIVRLETRPPNLEGKGEISIRSLVKTALRMRPDRIIVGEVRGGEALDMLQAMNTGHDGSLSTGHANSARDMLMRLETMVLMAGMQLPVISIRQQIASAVDFIVHLSRLRDGSRRVMTITEIVGVQEHEIVTRDIYAFQETGVERIGDKDMICGELKWTGNPIENTQKFISAGIKDFENYLLKGEKGHAGN